MFTYLFVQNITKKSSNFCWTLKYFFRPKSGKTVEFNYPGGDEVTNDGDVVRYEFRNNIIHGFEFLIDTTTKRYLIRFLNTKTNVKPIGE